MKKHRLYIDGRYVEPISGRTLPSVNPYTSQVWAEIPDAGVADVEAAVAAAERAYRETWRHTSGVARAAMMLKLAGLIESHAQRISVIESHDNGKILRDTLPQMKVV